MKWPLSVRPRAAAPADVVLFGENSLDIVGFGRQPDSGQDKVVLSTLSTLVGGQAATAAVGCARQHLRVRYVGVLGPDEAGRRVRAALANEHIDVVALEPEGAESRSAFIFVDARSGARTVYEFRHPALTLDTSTLAASVFTEGRALMLDATDINVSIVAARLARAAGVPTIVDVDRITPQTGALLAEIDVIVVAERFAMPWSGRATPGQALAILAGEFNAAVVVVTLGPEGSLALINGHEIATPGYAIDVVDTTGAGDAFRAGLVSAWLREDEPPSAQYLFECANATAALNCRALGAQTSLPTAAEVQDLVTRAGRGQSK